MTNIQWKILDRIYCAKTQATMNLVINMGDIENKPMSKLFKCKSQAYDYLDRRLERL